MARWRSRLGSRTPPPTRGVRTAWRQTEGAPRRRGRTRPRRIMPTAAAGRRGAAPSLPGFPERAERAGVRARGQREETRGWRGFFRIGRGAQAASRSMHCLPRRQSLSPLHVPGTEDGPRLVGAGPSRAWLRASSKERNATAQLPR
jgi:hypothetical protein